MGLSPGQETKIPRAGVGKKKKNCVWQGYWTQKLTQISLISKSQQKIKKKIKTKDIYSGIKNANYLGKKALKNPLCEKVQNLTEDNKDQNR